LKVNNLWKSQALLLVHLCLQFAQKYPNCTSTLIYLAQQNSYLTLPKDANAHGIWPT
jgi:hypothetical protein